MMVANQLIFAGLTKDASHNEQKSAAVVPDTSPLRQQPLFEGVKKCSKTNEEGASTSKQSPQIGEKPCIPGPPFDLKGTEFNFTNG